LLTRELAGPGTAPRVVVLCNVPKLSPEQDAAIGAFVDAGGGVLVAPGEAAEPASYTRDLHRSGRGWLHAALTDPSDPIDDPSKAARPLTSSFFHPALELFREPQPGGLGDARFPRYWRLVLQPGSRSVAVARLTTGDPFLVEATVGSGRVIQACVPLDNSWGTNLVELPAFAPLAHELIYYLAGARSAALNLSPGQPIRYRLPGDAPISGWSIRPPDGPERPIAVASGQIVFDETADVGPYVLRHDASGTVRYYVVQPDAAESDLSPATDADRERVRQSVPEVRFVDDRDEVIAGVLQAPRPAELWWLCLAGVIAMLSMEVWLTRRRALAAGD
jgi:hypothetical protein